MEQGKKKDLGLSHHWLLVGGPCYKISLFHSLLSEHPIDFLYNNDHGLCFLSSLSFSLLYSPSKSPASGICSAFAGQWIQGLGMCCSLCRECPSSRHPHSCCITSLKWHLHAKVLPHLPIPCHSLSSCPALFFLLAFKPLLDLLECSNYPECLMLPSFCPFLLILFIWIKMF